MRNNFLYWPHASEVKTQGLIDSMSEYAETSNPGEISKKIFTQIMNLQI